MKKRIPYLFCLFLLFGMANSVQAQDVTINSSMDRDRVKSVSKARSIALTNTALSIGTGLGMLTLFDSHTVHKVGAVVAAYGVLVGPSTGNFYANDYPRGFAGVGARTIGAILMLDASREIFGNSFGNALGVDDQKVSLTDTKILIGEAIVVGSLVYNLLSLKNSVQEFNNQQKKFAISVMPAVVNNQVAPMISANISL